MAQKDVGNKIPIYKLKKTDEVMKYYDEWGEGVNRITCNSKVDAKHY